MVDQAIIEAVRKYLLALQDQGLAVRHGVIFGSYAAGKAHQWSDIDLLVVSPQFDKAYQRKELDLLWRTTARTDSRIEPVPCGELQWDKDDSTAIIEIARREGVLVEITGDQGTPGKQAAYTTNG